MDRARTSAIRICYLQLLYYVLLRVSFQFFIFSVDKCWRMCYPNANLRKEYDENGFFELHIYK